MILVPADRDDVYPEQLDLELRALGIDSFSGLSFGDDVVSLVFSDNASNEDIGAALAVVAAHNSVKRIVDALDDAARFGARLIREYQIKMIQGGLLQSASIHTVAGALSTSSVLASTGSLVALDVELSTLIPIPIFLEAERITEMRNKVRAHLGMPPV